MKLTIIAGARPNFIKIAPIIQAIQKNNDQDGRKKIQFRLIHTGQHYDTKMSDTFFQELNIPEPNVNLGCGGGSQAEQAAAIMIAFEKDLILHPTDLVVVVGDVTSTLACSIVAKKQGVKVAHVEAGIRSFDLTMPEEINRMVTDSITDYFFTTSTTANSNLLKAGVAEHNIFFVGNVMIDTLLANKQRFRQPPVWEEVGLQKQQYLMLTLHRPSNVDEGQKLIQLIEAIIANTRGLPIIFPIHPRTKSIFQSLGALPENLHIIDPLGYLEFNYLVQHSKAVITDSGGITEETTVMGVPCLTLRDSTERPETVTIGTNELLGTGPKAIGEALGRLFAGNWKKGGIPELWDGKAAGRIVEQLIRLHA
ncbi:MULTISPECIES: non-hydrolyzing UDP-N-acetylglucosamine 2-epimerase [unclassified Imperialibacter]|uniref:non-hydrolyzing UDP-N-acetylglucosamine 2-epimerase n=1 Tax=unclassified Imperialibacter TaxID=2629706 RepID=UPI0012583FF7|nr:MULTISPECIES: UDP-N-acetylglucosamine 2-epimerase (non-hydrolyzing) [unclassified Imperialibacter]CAD5252991.1 UDP-N-acetylglucosamine 2-epimerase [Imperialibacter sp. 89]CAD5261160.1 UDP-N-acetylglucosamine 2-epimerase [Imperialibacter sp. 75]VVT03619.1 UDP-N-acetylglucosamine 2-epimerase [Imperialibacter sp. EC-SDR9]